MERFSSLTGLAASLTEANVDTDIIFPARFLLITTKSGLGRYAFYERRYEIGGGESPDFVLNQERFRQASILIAGENFGCGSSREQAVWSLRDLGFRCVISPSFGEIFNANCFKNGILPITLPLTDIASLRGEAEAGRSITVDLEHCQILRVDSTPIGFFVASWQRDALLKGRDEIAVILHDSANEIEAFESRLRTLRPWLFEKD